MSDAGGFDGSDPLGGPPVDLGLLPEIISVEQGEASFDEPRVEYVGTDRVEYRSAITFEVITDQPFAARALGPAVFVGSTPVLNWDQLEPNHYRFYAFEIEALEGGAPISVGWLDSEPERRYRTDLTFER
ncbi:MAG: hypothetical protein ACFCVK_19680 [Acidimicrobiales bacterium]